MDKKEEKKDTKKEIKKETKKVTAKGKVPVKKIEEKEPKEEVKEIVVEKKAGFNFLEVVIIMIITLVFGSFLGAFVVIANNTNNIGPLINSSSPISEELAEFMNVYDELKANYYEDIDEEAMAEAGIEGMIEYLGDPFTSYMEKEETDDFNQQVTGSYVGIGAEVIKYTDGSVFINSLFDNSSGMNAGLQVGDQIIAVNDEEIGEKTLDEISELLKGEEGSSVTLTVLRKEEKLTFSLVRRKVEITSVHGEVIEKEDQKIGMIKIDIFAENTFNQFEQELLRLQTKEIDSLIIDVRDNLGGHLSSVESIASLFIPKGKIIYQLETKGIKQPIYSTRSSNFNLPIVVLINGESASASEILASSLKESYGATLIGKTTFGKGTVQTTRSLSSGSQIKYTIQKWLTPLGNWVNEVGVKPDIEVDTDNQFELDPENNDPVLTKAIEVLTTK